jgi:hypothetical protein
MFYHSIHSLSVMLDIPKSKQQKQIFTMNIGNKDTFWKSMVTQNNGLNFMHRPLYVKMTSPMTMRSW